MGGTIAERFGISPLNGITAEVMRAEITFLCADVVGFTAMTQRLGDEGSFALMRRIARSIQAEVRSRGGRIVELRGDSFLLTLPSSEEAIACAGALHRLLREDARTHDDGGVQIRIAIHAGKVLQMRDHFFGSNVILPYRLLPLLQPGETGVSEAIGGVQGVRRVCRPKGFDHPVVFFVPPRIEDVSDAANTIRTREGRETWARMVQ